MGEEESAAGPHSADREAIERLVRDNRRGLMQAGLVPPGGGATRLPEAHDDPDRAAATADSPLPGTRSVLQALDIPAVLLRPIPADGGEIEDFEIIAVNRAAVLYSREPDPGFTGRLVGDLIRLRADYPGMDADGFFKEIAEVHRTGVPLRRRGVEWLMPRPSGWIERRSDLVSVSPCGSALLMTWERFGRAGMVAEAQRIADVGWLEWDLATGRAEYSSQMRTVLGPPGGPVGGRPGGALGKRHTGSRAIVDGHLGDGHLGDGHPADGQPVDGQPVDGPARWIDLVEPESLPAYRTFAEHLLRDTRPASAQITVRLRGRVRVLRVVAEPVTAFRGGPVWAVRAVVRDVTDILDSRIREEEAALEAHRQRRRAEAEAAVSEKLRAAIVPDLVSLAEAGLDLSLAYRPAGGRAGVGGDWVNNRVLPDGRALLALGDARGHGLDAAALMSKLGNALNGLAFTGAPVENLTTWLNSLACDDGWESTATAIIARYHPEMRTLRWTCAGHPPPILVRGGHAALLEAKVGPPLGVLPDFQYLATETALAPGDLVLLCTDGLVERRGTDFDDSLRALVESALRHADLPLRECVDAVLAEMTADLDVPPDDATVVALRALPFKP
ncbi:hypothetical protein BIV57_04415 [Mangrovactinospora gilvigrisea]|uniref:PPM-type phosphatase domain-containing protein n=1 Tax=Mangrovactinospora gilvigrisea TaxID=1428644 RepID=A0A1J7BYY8_9ACTN|nr:PP2C family protein-serine/threonine phosphatase [Mangrovactinospora gilvigrisea]OIV38697.1 hypothetical protein BIV57_04415 [Mangrovactinospora gilvigrisea]